MWKQCCFPCRKVWGQLMPACGQGQTFHQQPAINLEGPYQPTGVPELDETMRTGRQSWPQLCLFADPASEWRANTSGQCSVQRTRTELHWALETSETGQRQRPSVGSKETWVSGEIRLRRTEACGTADIWNHKPDMVFGTIQQGLMEPSNGPLTVFPSLIRARGQKWRKWHKQT